MLLRITRRGMGAVLGAWLLLGGLSGCSMLEEDNRRFLNWTDGKVRPESPAARVALAPVAIPVATATLGVDAALVHPVASTAPAARDVYDLYWKPRDLDPFTRSLFFLPCVALSPPTFALDWAGRILMPIK